MEQTKLKIEGLDETTPKTFPDRVFSVKTEHIAHTGTIQKILTEDDPMLKSVSEPFDFENPKYGHPIAITQSLIMSMKAYGGIGLAAVQVGWPIRVFCVGYENQTQVFFNPTIIAASVERTKMKEGCITYPFCFTLVERSNKIRVRYQNHEGTWLENDYSGYTARVIQHEYDHLDGITLRDKVSDFSWKIVKEKSRGLYKKALRAEKNKHAR